MAMNQKGFNLVEIMVAMSIFAIGFLAMAKMQITALQGNYNARGTTEAVTLLHSKVEELRMLPYGHADLSNNGQLGNPANVTLATLPGAADAGHGEAALQNFQGNNYRVVWNVRENWPTADVKTVRVIVAWNERELKRRLSSDFVRTQRY